MYKSNRARTRDLLLEYDLRIMPPRPRAAGIGMVYPWLNSNWGDEGWVTLPIPNTEEFQTVYPWESVGLSILGDQIYLLAAQSGYHGTREEFHHYFGSYLKPIDGKFYLSNLLTFLLLVNKINYILIQEKISYIIGMELIIHQSMQCLSHILF